MQGEHSPDPQLCLDTKCYAISARLILLAMYGATGYGIYSIYEKAHEENGNSAQTYVTTVG